MKTPKSRYTKTGGVTGLAGVEFTNYWRAPDSELVSVRCASMVLGVRLQAVVKLELPRYMVSKLAYYRKGDIQTLLLADQDDPNKLLRDLQESHRQVQSKQQANSSTRYKSVTGTLLPQEAKAVKQASEANRKKPLTKDELFSGWNSPLSRNKPVRPAEPMTEAEARSYEGMRERLREDLAKVETLSLKEQRAWRGHDLDDDN